MTSNQEDSSDFDNYVDPDNCAGGIATGSVVKDGRSIFWKNRHYEGQNEKPRFEQGPVYNFWMNTGTSWGMNEVGLAVGNFMQYGTLYNWQYYSTATYSQTWGIQSYLLGHFSTVADAAYFAAQHMGGQSSLGIVSAEPGVGAVVYSGLNTAGEHVCCLMWVNNSFMALSNTYECDGVFDSQWHDAQARLEQSFTQHGYIDWADVIQKGARDVRGREQGSGAFSTGGLVTNPNCLSSIIAVSGDPRWNGSANIAWTCLARQPLVGIFLPLGASYLQYTDESDMPAVFTAGGGMEDYVTVKVLYATNGAGQGTSTYYGEKVREIQQYAFQIENYSFDLYDQYVASLDPSLSQQTVETLLQNYVDTIVPQMIAAYENETFINQVTLTITTDGSGSVTKSPDQETYSYGQVVTLTAIPESGWMLSSWTGDLNGAMNPQTITMNGDKSVTAYFSDAAAPPISCVARVTSNPLDTDCSFGWVNISCIVTDNVAVSHVFLQIQNPAGHWMNVTMHSRGAGQYYYHSTTAFSSAGNHSYHIWAQDTNGNTNASQAVLFSMPPNWDINNDGKCTIVDLLLVANRYNEGGAAGWIREDVDNNGTISLVDLGYIATHYGETW